MNDAPAIDCDQMTAAAHGPMIPAFAVFIHSSLIVGFLLFANLTHTNLILDGFALAMTLGSIALSLGLTILACAIKQLWLIPITWMLTALVILLTPLSWFGVGV